MKNPFASPKLSPTALIVALALAGCGGSGGGSSSSNGGSGTTGAPAITTQPKAVAALAGSPVTLSVAATGTGSLTYQWKRDGTAIEGATAPNYTIASLSSATTGNYAADVTDSSTGVKTTTKSVAVTIAAQTAPRITTQPVSRAATLGSSTSFSVTVSGTGTISYQWKKNGVALEGANASSLKIDAVTADSVGSYTVTATNGLGSATSDPATLTVATVPVITTQPASQTINAKNTLILSVVAGGTSPLTYEWTKVSGSNPGVITSATSDTLTIANTTTAASGTYRVTVKNAYGSATSDAATVVVVGPPTITTSPTSLKVGVGDTASFTVAATGSGSLEYQWYKDGAKIADATGSTYQLTSATTASAGSYTVVVKNTAGSTTSDAATLTVVSPPAISTQPGSLTVTAGQSATFSVTATASGTLSYQWYRNGSLIVGATSSSYEIATTTTSDNGATFKVEVRNDGLAPKVSDSATLTVRS